MKNFCPEFETWEKQEGDITPGYQDIKCHLIFYTNMGEIFRRKARFVAGGNMTDTPTTLTYVSVVLRYLVRIALHIALSFDIYVYSKTFSLYPAYVWKVSPNYSATKII